MLDRPGLDLPGVDGPRRDDPAREDPVLDGLALDRPGPSSPWADGPGRDGAAAGSSGTANGVIVPPAAGAAQQNRLPIFESVESDWFRRGRHGIDRAAPAADPGSAPDPEAADWSSPGDAGWRAAAVAQAPVSSGYTGAGLPKRVPKANLVPGGVGTSPATPAPRPAGLPHRPGSAWPASSRGSGRPARTRPGRIRPPTARPTTLADSIPSPAMAARPGGWSRRGRQTCSRPDMQPGLPTTAGPPTADTLSTCDHAERTHCEPADISGTGLELAHHELRRAGACGGPCHRGLR